MELSGYGWAAACWIVVNATSAQAATPCDFKGLSVGDRATPEQIMKHFGVDKFADGAAYSKLSIEQRYPIDKARLDRAKIVGLSNAAEEEHWKLGPACDYDSCRIPYGVTVGSGTFPISVGVFVSFDKAGIIQSIDVSYDNSDWEEVMALLNTKYGNNWRTETGVQTLTDLETKKSELRDEVEITHRSLGTNSKTHDTCTLHGASLDMVFLHTTPPIYRSYFEIKLVSKNF